MNRAFQMETITWVKALTLRVVGPRLKDFSMVVSDVGGLAHSEGFAS